MCQYANEIHMHSFLESAHWHIYHIGSLSFLPYDDFIHKDEPLIRFISFQTDIAGFPVYSWKESSGSLLEMVVGIIPCEVKFVPSSDVNNSTVAGWKTPGPISCMKRADTL